MTKDVFHTLGSTRRDRTRSTNYDYDGPGLLDLEPFGPVAKRWRAGGRLDQLSHRLRRAAGAWRRLFRLCLAERGQGRARRAMALLRWRRRGRLRPMEAHDQA